MSKPKPMQFRKGLFDHETLTVRFGHELSKPENKFIATAVKVPAYKYTVMEPRDAGGGWYYEGKEQVEYTEDNAYIILRDGEVIGWMKPYPKIHNIQSELWPIDWKQTPGKIKQFAEHLLATGKG